MSGQENNQKFRKTRGAIGSFLSTTKHNKTCWNFNETEDTFRKIINYWSFEWKHWESFQAPFHLKTIKFSPTTTSWSGNALQHINFNYHQKPNSTFTDDGRFRRLPFPNNGKSIQLNHYQSFWHNFLLVFVFFSTFPSSSVCPTSNEKEISMGPLVGESWYKWWEQIKEKVFMPFGLFRQRNSKESQSRYSRVYFYAGRSWKNSFLLS